MNSLAELDLPHLPLETADQMRYLAEARAGTHIGYFVRDYSAIRELLGQDHRLRPAYDGLVEQFGMHAKPAGSFHRGADDFLSRSSSTASCATPSPPSSRRAFPISFAR